MNLLPIILAALAIFGLAAAAAPAARHALLQLELGGMPIGSNEAHPVTLTPAYNEIRQRHLVPVYDPDNGRGYKGGLTLAVNDASALDSGSLSEPLTAFAVGYEDEEDLAGQLERIAPGVPTSARFEYLKAVAANAAAAPSGNRRAPNGEFKLHGDEGTLVQDKLYDSGLRTIIDLRYTDNVDQKKQMETARLVRALQRAKLAEAFAVLNTAATNVAVDWSVAAPDPDKDIRDALRAVKSATGLRGNRVLISGSLWEARGDAYAGLDKARALRHEAFTPGQLGAWLNIGEDGVLVSEAVIGTRAAGKASIVTETVLYAYSASSGLSEMDASCLKRFYKSGAGGGQFDVWEEQLSQHLVAITVACMDNITQTSESGIAKRTVTLP